MSEKKVVHDSLISYKNTLDITHDALHFKVLRLKLQTNKKQLSFHFCFKGLFKVHKKSVLITERGW
jgi:hypothetical protein